MTIHMAFMDFCLATDSSHLQRILMKFLVHLMHATEINSKFTHQNTKLKYQIFEVLFIYLFLIISLISSYYLYNFSYCVMNYPFYKSL